MKSNFQNLLVWKKAMLLITEIYKLTEKFPACAKFSLASQMQRTAASIPSNITEGFERGTKKDFANFLIIAKSSTGELETQILIALMLKYLSKEKSEKLIENVVETKKILTASRRKVLQTTN